jgi:hypothetical protein
VQRAAARCAAVERLEPERAPQRIDDARMLEQFARVRSQVGGRDLLRERRLREPSASRARSSAPSASACAAGLAAAACLRGASAPEDGA